jgi:hypothetical protein
VPEGVITFKRQYLSDEQMPNYKESKKKLRKVLVRSEGTIEDCSGTIQVK